MSDSHWHYQVMYHKYKTANALTGEGYYAVHEQFVLDDGAVTWTENPVELTAWSIEDLKKSLMLMLNDIDKHGVKTQRAAEL